MIFRIEDISNLDGKHRKYSIPPDECPQIMLSDLSNYISNEIRKEVNNAKDRQLLSYSKSLVICLLKYNQNTDNELHINAKINKNDCGYINMIYENTPLSIPFDLQYDMTDYTQHLSNSYITLLDFAIDVSNNSLLDTYLIKHTNTRRKKVASPEKDYEFLLFQSPNDLIIYEYQQQVYVLLGLAIKYGFPIQVAKDIYNGIISLEDYRFQCCPEERQALLYMISYIFNYRSFEKGVLNKINEDNLLHLGFDSIDQFKSIIDKETPFDVILNDDDYYNCNVVSDVIMKAYAQYLRERPYKTF